MNNRNRRRRTRRRRSQPSDLARVGAYWRWVLPLLLASLAWYLGFAVLPAYTAAAQRERTLQTLDRIALLRSQAHQETDPVRARGFLLEALGLLRRSDLAADPDRAAQLRAAVERDLTAVDRVKTPLAVLSLGRLPDSADRLVLYGDVLYTLDRTGLRLRRWRFVPDRARAEAAQPEAVSYEGARPDGPHRPDMGVVPEGPNRGLVLFTGQGLILVRDGEARPGSIRVGPEVKMVAAVEGFAENLYVLDPGSRLVWRYLPTWNGFDADPKPALPYLPAGVLGLSLDRVAFALGLEGRLWLAQGNAWVEVDLSTVEPPPTGVRIIRADRQNRRVFLGDPERGRLIVVDYAGKFLGQVVAPELRGLADLAVDGGLNRAYIISQGALYRLDLPETK